MEKIITYETLRSFAYSNDEICREPIRGIVLSFFGLGGMIMHAEDTLEGEFFAEQGILYVVPYNNPWAWMNPQAVAYTDEILDVIIKKYALDDNIPIVSTGGSMGGQSALVYTRYAKRTPVACVANCPVCDVPYHFTERPDLPRTLYSAVFHMQGTLEEGLRAISPLHLVPDMPRVRYRLFHCDQDQAVNLQKHSETFVAAMKAEGFDIELEIVPGRGHCSLPYQVKNRYLQAAVDAIAAKNA